MGWYEARSMDVPVVDATNGAAVNVEECAGRALQVDDYVSGTYELHGSIDGTHYSQLGVDITAAGIRDIPETVRWVRVHCQTAPAVVPPATDPVPPTILLGMQRPRD